MLVSFVRLNRQVSLVYVTFLCDANLCYVKIRKFVLVVALVSLSLGSLVCCLCHTESSSPFSAGVYFCVTLRLTVNVYVVSIGFWLVVAFGLCLFHIIVIIILAQLIQLVQYWLEFINFVIKLTRVVSLKIE